MSFGLLKGNAPPIAVDFGVSSLKVLQIMPGDQPALIAAAHAPTPDELLDKPTERIAFQSDELARILRSADFRGKRAVCSISSMLTFVQHLQIQRVEGMSLANSVSQRLTEVTGRPASSYILRHIDVGEVTRSSGRRTEVMCVAIPREAVMTHMRALQSCKLEAVGVHTEHMALVRSIDHLSKRAADATVASLLVDIGYGSMRIVITHGKDPVLARTVLIGGRQLDAMTAKQTSSTLAEARRRRISGVALSEATMPSSVAIAAPVGPAASSDDERRVGAQPTGTTDLGVAVATPQRAAAAMEIFRETLTDEIALAIRYHRAIFPDQPISRTFFFGGESLHADLSQFISQELHLDASLGDPLGCLSRSKDSNIPAAGKPTPGWAVAMGLCVSPTDL